MKKMQKTDRTLVVITIFFLLAGCLLLSLFPAPRFSPQENRNLASFPAFTAEAAASGRYTAALDAYATERFPARVALRQARAWLQIATGRQEAGGVLLCRDGSLARRMTVNERAYAQNLTALQRMYSDCKDRLTVAVVHRRIDARQDVLPPLYDVSENKAVWDTLTAELPTAILFPTLTDDAHWYRTDHHWTSAGAYAAYCALGDALGYIPLPESAFTVETVSTNFYGTSHAAAGIPLVAPDRIELYRFTGEDAYTVKRDGSPAPFTDFYDFEKLQTRDQYAVFLGGNCGVLEIVPPSLRPKLLVVKDSFANALLPFLAQHYTVTAVDPRYCSERISDLASAADQTLVLCGMQTLCESPVFRTGMG